MNFTFVLLATFILLVALCFLDPVEAGKKDDSVLIINNGKGKVYYEDDGKKDKKKKKKKKGRTIILEAGGCFTLTVQTLAVAMNHRLPDHIVPVHYRLHLDPNFDNATFDGSVEISIEIKQAVDSILLNALELNITQAKLVNKDAKIVSIMTNEEDETLRLTLDQQVTAGSAILQISFSGTINDKLKGFYRSKYSSDAKDYAAVTQFQANGARMCFPCWDEPSFKATFTISLSIPVTMMTDELRVVSNMPSESIDPRGDRTVFTFMQTPKMSTYLVAFIVGKFDSLSATSSDGKTKIGVFVPLDHRAEGSFALEATVKLLQFYTELFGLPYPLPKLDLVSVPEMSFSGMENWGLITFRENAILLSPSKTSIKTQSVVAEVIAHELAHMWFGDLVTISWWSHLWLNEGFATFMAFHSVASLYPQYSIMNEFITGVYDVALQLDSLDNSHAILAPVARARDISEIFDDISYNKGASIIRMCESYVGSEKFIAGVSSYLKEFKYSNAETDDLLYHLNLQQPASSTPLKDVMDPWINQRGFPLIKVEIERNGDVSIINISQSKFRASSSSEPLDYKWHVPISIATSKSPSKPVKSLLLSEPSARISLSGIGPEDWIKLNPQSPGFYRVQYPKSVLESFSKAIQLKQLTAIDRFSILSDQFALFMAGDSPAVDILDMLPSFTNEDDNAVWSTLSSIVAKLSQLLSSSTVRDKWLHWATKLFTPTFEKIGWDEKPSESSDDKLLRALIVQMLASLGHPDVKAKCRVLFDDHVKKTREISVNLRSTVFSSVASEISGDFGDNLTTYTSFIGLYNETDSVENKNRILTALTCMQSESMINRLFEFSLSPQVRSEGLIIVLRNLPENPTMRRKAWQFFQDHAALIKSRYEGGFQIARTIKALLANFDSEEDIHQIENFFSNFTIAGTERSIKQSLEHIRVNINWKNNQLDQTEQYLKNH